MMSRTLGKLVRIGYASTSRNSNQTAKNLFILHSTTITRPFTSLADDKSTQDDTRRPLTIEEQKKLKEKEDASKRSLNRSLIRHYIDTANYKNYDERVVLGLFNKAVMVYQSMVNKGIFAGHQLYGPLLKFLLAMRTTMHQQFYALCDEIKKDDPRAVPNKNSIIPKLTYYETLLWVKIEDEIWKICDGAERQEKMSMLLETIDVKKVCSKENVGIMFKLMGRLLLESHAKKFLLELKRIDKNNVRGQYIANLIYIYATSIPNIQIEDIVAKFQTLLAESEIASLCARFEKQKLIKACCDSLKVDLAIDLVDSLLKDDFNVTVDIWNSILTTCDKANDFRLVHHIYSMMNDQDICLDEETFRIVISLCGKMKDFQGAYQIIENLNQFKYTYMDGVYKKTLIGYLQKFQRNNQKSQVVKKPKIFDGPRRLIHMHEIDWILEPLYAMRGLRKDYNCLFD